MEGSRSREAKTATLSIKGVGNQDRVGWVNSGEALLNVVMSNKRKMLSRLGQKARGQVRVLFSHSAQMVHHRRKGAT